MASVRCGLPGRMAQGLHGWQQTAKAVYLAMTLLDPYSRIGQPSTHAGSPSWPGHNTGLVLILAWSHILALS